MTVEALTPRAVAPPAAAPRTVLDGATLTPEAVVRVARHRARAELAPAASRRNLRARRAVARMLERGEPLYGASTGVGALCKIHVPAAERSEFQWNLLRSHAVDAGPPLPAEVVRAGMVVRANQLGAGGAGVAPELLDGLLAALAEDGVPVVRALGSLGTGDLPGLARIALAVLAPDAKLGLRDALGFISSNALTAGRACLLWHDTVALQALWLEVAALSFDAAGSDPAVLAARVHEAAGGPGQIEVAARLRAALGVDASPRRRPGSSRVQDPYPFRVAPQVDGASAEAAAALHRVLLRELNARAENALIDDDEAWPTGNFHAAALAAALDGLRGALAGSAALIAARVSALLAPAFLALRPGRDSGMMMLEYTAHAAAAELRSLATPVGPHTAGLSLGVESHASLAPISAARLAEQLPPLKVLVAVELVVAMRALAMAGRTPSGPHTAALHARAAALLPAELADRDFGHDVHVATSLVEAWLAED